MSKDLYFENNSNINNANKNNNVFTSNSSFNDSKFKINMNANNINSNNNVKSQSDKLEKKSSRKDLSYIDKFKFIKDCLKKVQEREMNEFTELSDLKQYEKTFVSKIDELKEDIAGLTKKIDEVKIAKLEVDKKIKNKEVYLKKKLNREWGDVEMNEEKEGIYLINEGLQNEIDKMNNEMKELGEEIQVMSEQSLDTHQDIETLKINCNELIKNNLILRKTIQKKEKELAKITLDNKKINDKINQQEINSEKFLKQIETWANKESNIKYNNLFDIHDVH